MKHIFFMIANLLPLWLSFKNINCNCSFFVRHLCSSHKWVTNIRRKAISPDNNNHQCRRYKFECMRRWHCVAQNSLLQRKSAESLLCIQAYLAIAMAMNSRPSSTFFKIECIFASEYDNSSGSDSIKDYFIYLFVGHSFSIVWLFVITMLQCANAKCTAAERF